MNYDKKAFGRVIVLNGGWGPEREVSLMSGDAVFQALNAYGLNVKLVDLQSQKETIRVLSEVQADRVFIAMHGNDGESGFIQAILDGLNIPYTGSGVAASALTLDKMRCKWLWRGLDLPTPASVIINDETTVQDIVAKIGLPFFLKPNQDGSSLGITKVKTLAEYEQALASAKQHGDLCFAEKFMSGGEYTVGIAGDRVLPAIKIETPKREFYDYQAKYFLDDTIYRCPAGLSDHEAKVVADLAWQAYQACGCRHWGRVDLIRDENGQFNLIEINPIPGLTSHSLLPKAAKQIGIDFQTLLLRVLAETL